MKEIFVNFKRFDVPRSMGGVCTENNPKVWIEKVIDDSIQLGIGQLEDMTVVYMLPEALIISAMERLSTYAPEQKRSLALGVQGVYRDDVAIGGNFGAFTTHLPAAAAANMGCQGVILGHCEERRDKQNTIARFVPDWDEKDDSRQKVLTAVDELIHEETIAAFKRGMNVLLCVGETATQRGEGALDEVKDNVKAVLRMQLERGLKGLENYLKERKLGIAYEPIWAIGPGKVPPNEEYITFVSTFIKEVVQELCGKELPVVYGGGLKEENAKMIAGVKTLDGGLVALTQFSGEIGFYTKDLKKIIDKYKEN